MLWRGGLIIPREGNVPRTLPATPANTDATATRDGSPPVQATSPRPLGKESTHEKTQGVAAVSLQPLRTVSPRGTQGVKTPRQAEEQLATLFGCSDCLTFAVKQLCNLAPPWPAQNTPLKVT